MKSTIRRPGNRTETVLFGSDRRVRRGESLDFALETADSLGLHGWVDRTSRQVRSKTTFLSPVVRHQEERNQRVVDTVPYGRARHPMYSSVGVALIMLVMLSVRAVLEERTLKVELEGYAEYMERVRYRLIPGIW